MLAGIITTPKRTEYLPALINRLVPYCRDIVLFVDVEMKGQAYNEERSLALLEKADVDEPVIILTDDTELCEKWYDEAMRIHTESGCDVMSLFTRKPNAVALAEGRGWYKGCIPRGFYDQAMIFWNAYGLRADIQNWLNSMQGRERMAHREKHFDVAIQEYLITHGIEWAITVPTLAEHAGAENSTLAHTVGRSVCYKG